LIFLQWATASGLKEKPIASGQPSESMFSRQAKKKQILWKHLRF